MFLLIKESPLTQLAGFFFLSKKQGRQSSDESSPIGESEQSKWGRIRFDQEIGRRGYLPRQRSNLKELPSLYRWLQGD
jgi:hypothetical protein